MVLPTKWLLVILLPSFYDTIVFTLNYYYCEDDSWYLIRSTASNLVLDGSNSRVTIQHFDGYTPQLWRFKRGSRPGLFYILNNSTETVLDVANDYTVILAKQSNESLTQQWYVNSNGRIVNAFSGRNLDITGARYVPGNPIIVYPDNGNPAQDFIVKEKRTCSDAHKFNTIT